MREHKFKGIKYILEYGGYHILEPVNLVFHPYAGNKLLNMRQDEREEALRQRVRYRINKYLQSRRTTKANNMPMLNYTIKKLGARRLGSKMIGTRRGFI